MRTLPLLSHCPDRRHIRAKLTGSTAMFNHVGDGIILTHHSEHTLRILDYPSLKLRESPAAHVGGCVAVALDPRGRWVTMVGISLSCDLTDIRAGISPLADLTRS